MVGVLATTVFLFVGFPEFSGGLQVFGIDGWNFVKRIGKDLGGILDDPIKAIENVAGDAAHGIADLAEDAFDAVGNFFGF